MSARRLHVVEERVDRVYVVARTRLVVPGRPYVVSECVGDALVSAPPGLETFTRPQMRREPSLASALEAWEEHDDSLERRERQARGNLSRSLPAQSTRARAQAMHPSNLGRATDIRRAIPPAPEWGA